MIETVRVFSALSEEFVELYVKHHPVAATAAGIHDYDHLMPDDSPEGLKERAAWLRDLEQRLVASVPWDELPVEPRVDYALLRSGIAALRSELEEIKTAQRNPDLFLGRAFDAVHLLLARTFAPLDERKEAAVARLMALPDYLDAVRPNLQQVPPELLERGIERAALGPAFVDEVVRSLLRQFPGEGERLEHAGSRARSGFLRFHDFLDKELRPRAGGSFAIGERWMNYKLEREHLLSFGCGELERLGREHMAGTRVLLEEEAHRLDRDRSWRELLAEGRERTPEAGWLRESYVAEVERARAFVADRRLVPLPAGEKLEVVDTPAYARALHPFTAYSPPAPFDAEATGHFLVTPIDLRRPKEDQARQLAAHCTPGLPGTTLRATYPGRHLQRGHANRAATRLRKLADSELFAAGWALYCGELMWEEGFLTADPLARLFQLAHLLTCACLAVVDASLHSGRMGLAQATQFLCEEAELPEAEAARAARRCCGAPTAGMSDLVGKLQLRELRDEAQRRLGARFTLHDFHAALLASGTLPPALVQEELWARLGSA